VTKRNISAATKSFSFFRFVTKNFDLYREKKFHIGFNVQEIHFSH
jgi:hypothetical protein